LDLGDTKLFDAAVLPAVLVAERSRVGESQDCEFIRVYEEPNGIQDAPRKFESILDALDGSFHGVASVNSVRFRVETGHLQVSAETRMPWSIVSDQVEDWLETVKRHSAGRFSDFGKVCVGIKTTADPVFIRDDWETLPEKERPEEALLRPLITHHTAARWSRPANGRAAKRVLYPYTVVNGRRAPVNLAEYPLTRAYLERHREALERRTYVTDSGRQWFEIWVAHHPDNWSLRKVVFPDISASNSFFVADEGWIVNGDCYWIKLLPGVKEDWLWLMLAVANSSFILKYYDVMFHNKLYSGRRRFQSQYVERFPLPKLETASELLDVVSRLVKAARDQRKTDVEQLETVADGLVWKAFGLSTMPLRF
jgi:adenine-specific DNA-methyltransferase